MNDPYKVLGVEPGSSPEDIKKAYIKLAMEHHPDRNPDDKTAEDKCKEINAAYELIKDGKWKPERRMPGFNPFNMNSIFRDLGLNVEFNDMFSSKQTKRKRTGRIQISLEEVNSGCKKNITVMDNINCQKCKGIGFELSDKHCKPCNGSGQIRTSHGVMLISQNCPYCRGLGREVLAVCIDCQGTGKKANSQNFEVVIPAGINHGGKIYPVEDLEIAILYAPHPEFILMENMVDIMSKIKISMFDALLGGGVKINTLQGQKFLKVTPGTQPNTILRIKSAGMKGGFGGTGDHLVEVLVELPKALSVEQEGLLLKLKETMENKEENNG